MSAPRTLLEMAGVMPAPPPLEQAALVLIDCQREYVDGLVPLHGIAAALDEVGRLLACARQAGVPVTHIRHRGRAGGLFDPAGTGFAFAGGALPEPGEPVLDKALPNAFAGTELKDRLEAGRRRHLIFAGFMTHMCVSSSVRAALDLGFASTVVASACATRDLPDGSGGVLRADDLHRAELVALSDRFAAVLPNAAALTA